MKNISLFIAICLLLPIWVQAQWVTPVTISGGSSSGSSSNYQIQGTLGQLATSDGSTDSYLVTEGFHQPNLPLIQENLPYYKINEIPAQTAYANIETAFYVYVENAVPSVSLSYEFKDMAPSGEIYFNSTSGKFSFIPDEEDKGVFTVIFRAEYMGTELWQEVDIRVIPALNPEQTTFGLEPYGQLPSEADDDYILRSDFLANNNSYSIAGKKLVFDKNLRNKLTAIINNAPSTLKELNLYAETVLIRSALHFPGVNVNIHARYLIFEDGNEVASISTQPESPQPDPVENNASNAAPAGNISLHVQDFSANFAKRFRLIGGKGQGSRNRKGGNGGNGGSLSSTLALEHYGDLLGGAAGKGKPFGNKGQAGSFNRIQKEYSWLTSYALKMILKHAKAAYLNGYMNYTQQTFEDYIAIIDAYKASSEWVNADENERFEIEQMQSEMNTLLYRIASNLDYFGNPAGWVPMLSFEINKLAFEEEIDRAIRVLYLSYWVQRLEASRDQKVLALEDTRNQIQASLIGYQNDYDEAVTLLPQLETEAEEIIGEMEILQEKLEMLEQELSERAKYIVEERHRPPKTSLWRKITRTVGTIAQVVPVFQPALGAIGGGLNVIAGLDFNDPLEAVSQVTGVVKSFKDIDFKASVEQFKSEMDKLDFSDLDKTDPKELKEYYENLKNTTKPVYDAIAQLRGKVGDTEVPLKEIQVELDRLKAESPEFTELVAQTDELMLQKAQFQQKITVTLQSISTLFNNIQNGVLATQSLKDQIFQTDSKKDLKAIIYVDDMAARAKERLIKYHYYMGKAFEYRLLRPYNQELNLSGIFERIRDFVEEEDADPLLTASEFESLKAIYEEKISTVTDNILDIYNQNAPEISAPVRFNLTEEDLALLNAGLGIRLNMVERGIFPAYEENIRIRAFKIIDIQTHFEDGSLGDYAYSDLIFEHSGISKLKKDSEVYQFNHYNNENENPITWGIRFDAFDGLISPKEPSLYSESLLRSLLESLNRYSQENLAVYSRPAAWADIIVRKTDIISNDLKIVFDEVHLEVLYDFQQRPDGQVNVEVVTNNEMKPFIQVNKTDKNDRKDGWGSFIRTYFENRNGSIELNAPSTYGSWVFDKWTDFSGNPLGTDPALRVGLDNDKLIKANYLLIQPELAVGKDTIFLPFTEGSETVNVSNVGTGEMSWNAILETPWVSSNISIDNSKGDGRIKLFYEANETGNDRETKLVVIAPSSIDYRDTITIIQRSQMSTGADDQILSDQVQIYPNPTSGEIFIELDQVYRDGFVSVYNTAGSLVMVKKLQALKTSLDLSSRSRGLYLVRVNIDGRMRTNRILLE